MFIVLTSGLPISARELLNEAMSVAFDGMVDIQELTDENLRSKVRLSSRSVEIILVVLDSVSADSCQDIENGLFQSDKYFAYTSDKDFANFLNVKYGLSLVVEELSICDEEVDSGSEECTSDGIKNYLEEIKLRDGVISNLEQRIRDLTDFYGDVEECIIHKESEISELDSSLMDENTQLSDKLSLSNEKVKELEGKLSELDSLREARSELEGRIKNVSDNYSNVVSELNELKITYSKQTGVLRDKDAKIKELDTKLTASEEKVFELESFISGYKKMLADEEDKVNSLNIDLASKDKEIAEYKEELKAFDSIKGINEELAEARDTINNINKDLLSVTEDRDNLSKKIIEKDDSLTQLQDNYNTLKSSSEKLRDEVYTLKSRIKSDDESLALLNKEKLELQSRLNVLEKLSNGQDGMNDVFQEVQDLRDRLIKVNNNIFTRIGQSALPSGTISARVLNGEGRFSNIRFVFSGSSESRKGTYKCLLDEFRADTDSKYLLVDLVSETFVDYVFEVKKLVPGIEWFKKGGGLQNYLSDTVLKSVKVLSNGMGYINDSYFLCIDWASRLQELEDSGYKVVLYCGDISNIIGRVLYDSFTDFGKSSIYVMGSTVSARSIITNLRGLSNGKSGEVLYFDFNDIIKKFYDMVDRTNECKIISYKGSTRR